MRYIVIFIFNLRDQFSWSRPCVLEIKCGSNGLCDLLKTFFFHCAMKKIAHGWAGRWCSSFWCSYMWILASATWGLVLLFFFFWLKREVLSSLARPFWDTSFFSLLFFWMKSLSQHESYYRAVSLSMSCGRCAIRLMSWPLTCARSREV